VEQGSLALLQDPVAQALLRSTAPARVAYLWTDGTPRVVPIWFHWSGMDIVLGSPPRAPKLAALRADPRVAVTIDGTEWPYKVLLVRGEASVELLDDVAPEYEAAAMRYFGDEGGRAWVDQLRGQPMARITVQPRWVAVLDFETRFPSALSS
jgi:PPOX class probable F420-dependent enzyme